MLVSFQGEGLGAECGTLQCLQLAEHSIDTSGASGLPVLGAQLGGDDTISGSDTRGIVPRLCDLTIGLCLCPG